FAHLIAYGEFLVGVGLLLGAFTGVAALFGAALNVNYMLAGSAGLNPVLFLGALLLLLAWRVSGYVGLDRWLLPLAGTPWQPGWLFRR
ncbi:MAG TPA: DoxX family protein, partial [Dehalococcoidia bacterium]|nr:DoxX family protein [Dehalococcoidia bacterium]